LFFLALSLPIGAEDNPQGLVGTWAGSLDLGGQKLPIVFHISLKDGSLFSTWDSPSQGAKGLPTASVSLLGGKLTIDIPVIKGSYSGLLDASAATITGTWKQGPASLPLSLSRTTEAAGPARPQEPKAASGYSNIELSFPGGAPGVTLAASLSVPSGPGPFPAVILVTGSGPQDRDETILDHKPFLVIADYLARHGVAVLRYDDRGVASSTGDFSAATTLDFAADAQAAVDFLAARKEAAPGKVGIVGHSEGGLIAPIVAARDTHVSFIVLLSGPGMRGDELLLLQSAAIAKASGASDSDIADMKSLNAGLYAAAISSSTDAAASGAVKKAYLDYLDSRKDLSETDRATAKEQAGGVASQLASPWMRTFLSLDPSPYLAALSIPVLALGGTKDLQVPVDENFAALKEKVGPKATLTEMRLNGLNHLFQHAGTGLPSEYGVIEETFAPEALAAIGDWIGKR
jgi:fermentation-respiration switch protein FrsA (DUF1100 family)